MSKKKDFKPDPKAEELQGKIQVDGQANAGNVDPVLKGPNSGKPEIQEFEEPKAAINTKRAAEVVTAGTDSSGIGGLRRGAIVFSGGAGRTQGDMSATTKEGTPYKSGDRFGRRADPITRKIDLVDAEIFKTKLFQSKPLCETSEGQGFRGNYNNEHAITQKNSGGAPADPLFERSVDEIDLDMLYYPVGQMNIAKQSKQLVIHDWDESLNSGNGGYSSTNFTAYIGNYFTRWLTVKLNTATGKISGFAFEKHDLSVPHIDEATYRLAGDAYLRLRNQVELDRNVIISKAGNESDPSWSCLGDALPDVSDQNVLLRLYDASVGDLVGLSLMKLETACSFQLNKASKDGSRVTGPMAEMANGCIELYGYGANASVSEANGRDYQFNAAAYVKGGAGLWNVVNDSIPKYTTKGKDLSLPLGFKFAAATARANMDPLVMDELLLQELAHAELFSTIDGPYDPVKPIVVTDKAALITPLPIDICKSGTIFNTSTGTLEPRIYTMHYENMRNKYNININNYFIMGLYRWFEERASRLIDACKSQKDSDGIITIEIPVMSSTTCFSLWDLIVCQSVPYIVEARLKTFTEVLKYERNFGYPYTGTLHLKEANLHACENYQFNGVEEQLVANIAKPVAAMKVIMPEVFWPVAYKTGYPVGKNKAGRAAFTVLPHYFVQNQFAYDKDNDTTVNRKLVLSDEGATIAYPTTRSGNNLSYMDTVYGMSEEDYRLSLDRMVVYPGYEPSYDDSKLASGAANSTPLLAKTYKYGLTADGCPVIPYFAYATNAADVGATLQIQDVLATPRELGLFQVAPAGVLTPIPDKDANNNPILNRLNVTASYLGKSGPGFRVKVYHGVDNSMANTILSQGSVNINANASFRNNFEVVYATPESAATDIGFWFRATQSSNAMKPFVSGSYSSATGSYDSTTGLYAGSESADNDISIYSDFKYLWPRLQRLPFVVNPFDCNTASMATASSSLVMINSHDIYDFMYMFNLAGFRASDFTELSYGRERQRIAKGMNYVIDPYVAKSLLLK